MSHFFKSIGKIIKPVGDVAAALTGNPELIPLINGGTDLVSGKGIGASLGDAALSFAGSEGLGALGNAFPDTLGFLGTGGNSLTDLMGTTQGAGSLTSPLQSLFGSSPAAGSAASNDALFSPEGVLTGGNQSSPLNDIMSGAQSNVTPSGGEGNDILSGDNSGLNFEQQANANIPSNAAASSTGSSTLQGILSQIQKNPGSSAMLAANLITKLQGVNAANIAQTQQQKAQQATAANNAKFISSLNSGPLDRTQTNAPQDYYHYGERANNPLFYNNVNPAMSFAKGGKVPNSPLDAAKGQADTVKANLSKGEYVIPADAVSSLGDGNSDAGGKMLDSMVSGVRKQKAPAMKKGVLPPKAKSPLAYVGA